MTGKKKCTNINLVSFTKAGMRLAEHAAECMTVLPLGSAAEGMPEYAAFFKTECNFRLYTKYKMTEGRKTVRLTEDLISWVGQCFRKKEPLIFVGACGIAVRAIAPFVRDKLSDIPVLVMDETGEFVIPVLSGHYGGANELAFMVAKAVGATPVITTATDVNRLFAVDVFARKNEFILANRQNIARISGKILEQKITMQICGNYVGEVPEEVELLEGKGAAVPGIAGEAPEQTEFIEEKGGTVPDVLVAPRQWYQTESADKMLHLIPRVLVLGMGCRKGKDPGELEAFILRQLNRQRIPIEAVKALATIDIKREEAAFLRFAEKYQLEFLVFSAEQLGRLEGDYESSDFVKRQVGVDNVCERAAALGAGENGRLICRKAAEDGMTLAVAERDWCAVFS